MKRDATATQRDDTACHTRERRWPRPTWLLSVVDKLRLEAGTAPASHWRDCASRWLSESLRSTAVENSANVDRHHFRRASNLPSLPATDSHLENDFENGRSVYCVSSVAGTRRS